MENITLDDYADISAQLKKRPPLWDLVAAAVGFDASKLTRDKEEGDAADLMAMFGMPVPKKE